MFSIEFLHIIRHHELEFVGRYLPSGTRILEIGGGTGFQARHLAERGLEIESIDVPQSNYAEERVFPVLDYDGTTIPFPNDSFDVVFSSNVLEHVLNLTMLNAEIGRVLKPTGYCLHVMPSGIWRLGEIATHYLTTFQRLDIRLRERRKARRDALRTECEAANPELPRKIIRSARGMFSISRRLSGDYLLALRYSLPRLVPPRHGEVGNAFSEIVTFSRYSWIRRFRRDGYELEKVKPMGLFYTGYMLCGLSWSLPSRARFARWFGSSCIMYKVRPKKHREG